MLASEPAYSTGRRGQIGFAAAAFGVFALGAWAVAYASGAFPWLGYAWMTRSSDSLGPIKVVGETRSGTKLGAGTFLFFSGQEVVVDYDAEIRAGSLWLYVYEPFDGVLGDGVWEYVTASGHGVWRVPIKKTGIYTVVVEPSPVKGAGTGWDLSYRAWWGARPTA
jgi:hypothetical protein